MATKEIPTSAALLALPTLGLAIVAMLAEQDGIIRIAQGLRLPECIITDARDRVSCYEALAMLLKRLAFPCRLSSLRKSFGRSEGVCCRVTLCVASLIMDRWNDLLFFSDSTFDFLKSLRLLDLRLHQRGIAPQALAISVTF
ncbi:hypothetical protein PF001_g29348 [Phytophthora fragariae]|uniref:DDE Tnp4 domain-containing protein n=2 Tax=Phytophthora fragariae TaxID=53985 RepID=A0A6A3DD82_9STRA|nr:hypothetical protein PF009_g30102 [Phytophthora fragariae]KAE9269156.1 hypothetical protein PF001_g29348 [Phytophthora fragariae]